ncbi:Fasciclin-like arabinogalactan protein 17 [Platanthera guangdongensis]|uniref:Fasciclin-like arabinogalactan protein 17 n=1 Tax=Platanthera guangdongensis TaxID=2320717 RepID=A0ABR2MNH7_9ASPA
MDFPIYGGSVLLPLIFMSCILLRSTPPALPSALPTTAGGGISSNSVLVALLDSHYTELAELVEKALLLQILEDAVGRHNLTVFAPRNEALERDLDPDFKRFLLQPRNLKSLQSLLLFHFVPTRIPSSFPSATHRTLAGDKIRLSVSESGPHRVDLASILSPEAIVRPDGVIHGIDSLLVPRSVQEEFNRRRNLADISAVLPIGAPEVDPRTHRLKKPQLPSPAGSPPALPIFDAIAPGPSLAPAPAPGPGSGKHWFDGHRQIKDFIQTLILYGGYNEFADILMGRLVSEGYVLTVLAPNDEAMARLTADRLKYQTEESMYNAVRRFGKVQYDTLHLPHKIVAREADGSVKFGQGEGSAYLFDPDIYTDGRISVQGIDTVLFPSDEQPPPLPAAASAKKASPTAKESEVKLRRGE